MTFQILGMELSEAVLEGIRVAGSTSFDEKRFQDLLAYALQTLQQSGISSTYDEGLFFNIFFVLTSLFSLCMLLAV